MSWCRLPGARTFSGQIEAGSCSILYGGVWLAKVSIRRGVSDPYRSKRNSWRRLQSVFSMAEILNTR